MDGITQYIKLLLLRLDGVEVVHFFGDLSWAHKFVGLHPLNWGSFTLCSIGICLENTVVTIHNMLWPALTRTQGLLASPSGGTWPLAVHYQVGWSCHDLFAWVQHIHSTAWLAYGLPPRLWLIADTITTNTFFILWDNCNVACLVWVVT